VANVLFIILVPPRSPNYYQLIIRFAMLKVVFLSSRDSDLHLSHPPRSAVFAFISPFESHSLPEAVAVRELMRVTRCCFDVYVNKA
jgi:hypothetical protein